MGKSGKNLGQEKRAVGQLRFSFRVTRSCGDTVILSGFGSCRKYPLGLREGATENAAASKALLEDLIERGLDPNCAIR